MARFCPLFSSSSGNCIYIGSADGGILIDAGVSAKKISMALRSFDIEPSDIAAIFVTHEHSDHVSGLRVFAGNNNIDVYSSEGTLEALDYQDILTEKYSSFVIGGDGVEICGMHIRPFRTSHDSRESVGYSVVTGDGRRASVVTDTGIVTDEIMAAVQGSDLVMLESNHDIRMLENGPYPYFLKRRILSTRGHLCNEVCADTASELLQGGTTRFILGHLSRENNLPLLAKQTTKSVLDGDGAKEGVDYLLSVVGAADYSPEMTLF